MWYNANQVYIQIPNLKKRVISLKKIKVFATLLLVVMMLCVSAVSVFAVNYEPVTKDSYSLRLDGIKGMRVLADVERMVADDELATEIGFIVTRNCFLNSKGITADAFYLDSDVKMVKKAAKETVDGNTVFNYFNVTDETMCFSGVFVGIDEEHYNEVIVAKPYVIYDDSVYYGDAIVKSFYEIAKLYTDNQKNYDALSYEHQRKIDDIIRKADGFSETLKNNLVVPTMLDGKKTVKTVYDTDKGEDVCYVYALVDGEAKYIPVDTEYSEIVLASGKLNDEFDAKICTYTIKNGLYCVTPVACVVDEDGNYIGIEKDDISYLDYKNPKRTFYFENNVALEKTGNKDGVYTVSGYSKAIELVEGYTQIIVRDEKNSLPYICSYSVEDFVATDISCCDMGFVTFVVSNNIDSTECDFADVVYVENHNGVFENTNPYFVPEVDLNNVENIIIPTTLDGEKPAVNSVFLPGLDSIDDFVYAYSVGQYGYIPVYHEGVLPELLDAEGNLADEYEDKLCVYEKDENGVYHLRSLGYALDENGNYAGLEKQNIGVLDSDEEQLFYAELYDAKFEKIEESIFDAGFERKLDISGAKIFVRITDESALLGSTVTPIRPSTSGGVGHGSQASSGGGQGDVNIDLDDLFDNDNDGEDDGEDDDDTSEIDEVFFTVSPEEMETMFANAAQISLVIRNNPDSNEVEKLVAAYIITGNFEFVNCENSGHICREDRIEAKCTEDGKVTYTCSREGCTYSYEETLSATGHDEQLTDTKPATCSEYGHYLYECQNDGCDYSYTTAIPYTGHNFGDWTTYLQPDCTNTGLKRRECVNCHAFEFETIPALGHKYVVVDEKLPTCTEDGYIDFECSNAGCSDTKRQTLEAEGHSFGLDNICDNCGYATAPGHDHEYDIEVVDPTCTEMGYTQYTCDECGHFYRIDYIEQLGHKYIEGDVLKERTCLEEGLQEFICERCDNIDTRTIPSGHNWQSSITVEATCTQDGEKTNTCTFCGVVSIEVIEAAHNWNEGRVIKEPDCKTEGQKECTCLVCGETEIFDIPADGHQYVNGTCRICGDYFMDNVVYLEESQRYGMYFSINEILSDYGTELIDEYGVYLDHNETANIKKVAVYLTQQGTMWRRAIACTGDNITDATYVPYLARDGELYYSGLNHSWINTFRLSKNSYGIWEYNNYATIGVNLQDAYGNLLLTLSDIGKAGYQTRIFDNLTEMKLWLMDGACEHSWQDTGEYYIAPTCTVGGVKVQKCALCQDTQKVGVSALGHIMNDWYVVKEPTLEEEGLEKRDCKNCTEYFETRTVEKLKPEKFDPAKLVLAVSDNGGVSMTQTVVRYNPATGKDEHYLKCYIDKELVEVPINPDSFYPSIKDCYDDYMDTFYIGDITSYGTSAYVDKLANVTIGSDGRYVIKPVLHVQNKNGQYAGINRSTDGIFDDDTMLYGNDLANKKGYLKVTANSEIKIVDSSDATLVGDNANKIKYLKLVPETRIIIKNKSGSVTEYIEYSGDELTSSVASELTNIQYVVTGADREDSSADLLVLYAETKNFAYVTHTVIYNIEPTGEITSDEITDGDTLVLPAGPAVSGWYFDCWMIGEKEFNAGDEIQVRRDLTITAKYNRAYTVTYVHSCCGTRTTQYCKAGDVITLPEAHACAGYRFDSWKVAATGSAVQTLNPGDKVTVNSNVTITTNQTRLYEVTYNYGCCGTSETMEIASGTKLVLEKPEHECEGYVFANFAIADRTGNLKNYNVGDTVTISKATTIECVYKKVYTVTLYEYVETQDGLEESSTTDYQLIEGEYFELPAYPVFNQCRVDTWIVKTSSGVQFKNEFEQILVNENIEITLDYTQVLTVTFTCHENFEHEIFYFEEGETVYLSQLHSGHDSYYGCWEYDVNGVRYIDGEMLTIEENLEIVCNYYAYTVVMVEFYNVYGDDEMECCYSESLVYGDLVQVPAPVNDDYWIFKGWMTEYDEIVETGSLIEVKDGLEMGCYKIYGYYIHVPEFKPQNPENPENPDEPGIELPPEVDTELLEMVSEAREEIRDIRMTNSLQKETRQEIVDTVKYVMFDIYEGVDVSQEYVRETYEEQIESIKTKVKEEMTPDQRSTFVDIMLDGVSENVKNFLADYFGIDLDNIEI